MTSHLCFLLCKTKVIVTTLWGEWGVYLKEWWKLQTHCSQLTDAAAVPHGFYGLRKNNRGSQTRSHWAFLVSNSHFALCTNFSLGCSSPRSTTGQYINMVNRRENTDTGNGSMLCLLFQWLLRLKWIGRGWTFLTVFEETWGFWKMVAGQGSNVI